MFKFLFAAFVFVSVFSPAGAIEFRDIEAMRESRPSVNMLLMLCADKEALSLGEWQWCELVKSIDQGKSPSASELLNLLEEVKNAQN